MTDTPHSAKDDHVVFDTSTGDLKCLHCGQFYRVNMPIAIDLLSALGRAFNRMHRWCKVRQL